MNDTNSILKSCQNLILSDANEAAVRLKVVDRVLREILGWTDNDIFPEEHVSEDGKHTFADYVLKTANVGVIVETKKAGADFPTVKSRRKERLTANFVSGPLGDAIIQARDYCRGKGIDFAVVTNGNTWIVFPAQRHDQVAFKDSYAFVFSTLQSALTEDFQEFHDLLSRQAVINGNLEMALIGRQENQLASRTLGNLLGSSGRSPHRNPVYPLIQPGIEVAFSDAIGELEGELLAKSYVSTPERIRFDQRIGMHLRRKASLFAAQPQRPMKAGEEMALVDRISGALKRTKPLAVIVLGSVGTGKTTFLEYTRKVSAAPFFEKQLGTPYPHWIYVDFRAFTSEDTPKKFIYNRMISYINVDPFFQDYNSAVEPAYRVEIESLKKGPLFLLANDQSKLNDKIVEMIAGEYTAIDPYVEKLVRNAARNAPVFLVVDNIDQIEAENLESQLFADVLAIGQLLNVNIVISMRDSTYAKYRSAPVFDAYDFDPIQIDVPKISSVLSKRFQLARFLVAGHGGDFIAENGARVDVEDASVFIDIVQSSVLGSEVGRMIEVLANEDVRLALRMTRQFLETGYSNPGRALEVYKAKRSYTLPRHEALRAILQGGASVYKESLSTIGNPFDARLGRTEAQPLRIYILSGLVNLASYATFRYAEVQSIIGYMATIGFGADSAMRAICDLCSLRFAFNVAHTEVNEHSSVVPSRLGGYVVRELICDFVFLEAMLMDTFIPDEIVWERLRELTQNIEQERDTVRRVKLRIARVREFFAMLHDMAEQVTLEAKRRGLPNEWCVNPFVPNDLDRNLDRVEASAIRNYAG